MTKILGVLLFTAAWVVMVAFLDHFEASRGVSAFFGSMLSIVYFFILSL